MADVRRVAVDLMSNRGFDDVTVEEIARAAHVSPSTVYRHFGTKEALVMAVDRPQALVDAIRVDESDDPSTVVIRNAVIGAFARDPGLATELELIRANEVLVQAFERQLLDRRHEIAELLAARRGANGARLKDEVRAGAALVAASVTLLRWTGGSAKKFGKSIDKAFAALAFP